MTEIYAQAQRGHGIMPLTTRALTCGRKRYSPVSCVAEPERRAASWHSAAMARFSISRACWIISSQSVRRRFVDGRGALDVQGRCPPVASGRGYYATSLATWFISRIQAAS